MRPNKQINKSDPAIELVARENSEMKNQLSCRKCKKPNGNEGGAMFSPLVLDFLVLEETHLKKR